MSTRDLEFWNHDEWKSRIADWPKTIRRKFGARLRAIQDGTNPQSGAKFMAGFKIPLWELKHRDGQRVIYTLEYADLTNCVYVLDAFMKDSRKGSEMRKADKKRIAGRVADLKERMDRLIAEDRAKRKRLH